MRHRSRVQACLLLSTRRADAEHVSHSLLSPPESRLQRSALSTRRSSTATPPSTWTITADLNTKGPRIVRQIENHFRGKGIAGGKFSHLKSATMFLREQAAPVPTLGQTALTRTENLFIRLNGLLPS